jgi:hypothetical protein
MLGRFRFNDEPLAGDDGGYDSGFIVVTMGVLMPLAAVGVAAYAAWSGGITLRGKFGPPVRYEGVHAVAGVAGACVGLALLLVAKYLLPNVFRRSYRYQYVALAGAVTAVAGLACFVGGAMRV